MAKQGIIGISPEGKTAILYNNRTFYTTDKSVIAMAARGNVEGAAKRWLGKSSAARSIRAINKQATKPIYKDVAGSLLHKTFKEPKNQIGTSSEERKAFVEQYKQLSEDVGNYIDRAVSNNIGLSDVIDKLPNDLQQKVKGVVREEVEKAYAAKGEINDHDVENIYDRVVSEMSDYAEYNELDPNAAIAISDYIGDRSYIDFIELEDY